jgi:hypothetical protein
MLVSAAVMPGCDRGTAVIHEGTSDIVADPDRGSLVRLGRLLAGIDAERFGIGDFSADEFPFDPLDPDQVAQGENFRLKSSLGAVAVTEMDRRHRSDRAYSALAREAIRGTFRGRQVIVAGFDDLRAMKLAAGGG